MLSRDAISNTKRTMDTVTAPAAKRQRIPAADENTCTQQDRECSASPEPSSIFDSSAIDTSQVTCTTEPDADALVQSPPRLSHRPTITREEARQKAETLRLRLGLAGYKLRTGQVDVPLERLQVRRTTRNRSQSQSRAPHPGRTYGPSDARQEGSSIISPRKTLPIPGKVPQAQASPEKSALPRVPASVSFSTPTRTPLGEDNLSSSAIKGGAAKGLLSLSRS